jgi:hypothetical protein
MSHADVERGAYRDLYIYVTWEKAYSTWHFLFKELIVGMEILHSALLNERFFRSANSTPPTHNFYL